MKNIILGRTGIEVTELCFGALPCGPLQKNLSVEEGGECIAHALELGVTMVDTAQMYNTYAMVKYAMDKTGKRPVISTKSAAATYEDMEKAINEALEKMTLDKIDIMLLHAARVDDNLFEIREGAWQCMKDYKAKGLIKAIGVATHSVRTVRKAASLEEVDVVFPLINKIGRGIIHGTHEEMEKAIEECFANNKGIYFMKAFAGGFLLNKYDEAMKYCMDLSKGRAVLVLGMVAKAEVDMNISYITGKNVEKEIETLKSASEKYFIVVKGLCSACGKCIEACHSDAIVMDEKAAIDKDKCVTCGYCVGACPEFAIRMI
ncbi:MAG: aldo/keto reductase [Defluviitaleaceae bacterium]|nr:aldo/keto reductase [Defluviitaleaceae bacterium]